MSSSTENSHRIEQSDDESAHEMLRDAVAVTPAELIPTTIPHVGRLALKLPVDPDIVVGHVTAWEHIPIVHTSSFTQVDLISEWADGWLVDLVARAALEPVQMELRLVPDQFGWVTRIRFGPAAGTEVWTQLRSNRSHETELIVDFFTPHETPSEASFYRDVLTENFVQFYAEATPALLDQQDGADESRRRPNKPTELTDLQVPLPDGLDDLSTVVIAFGTQWRLVSTDAGVRAHAARCPYRHMSMVNAEIRDDQVMCPWHGYRFDLATGRRVDGGKADLPQPPSIHLDGDTLVLRRRGH